MINNVIKYNIVNAGLSDPIMLFISHSSQNKDIVNSLIDIVQSGLNINSNCFFSHSLTGKLSLCMPIADIIRI